MWKERHHDDGGGFFWGRRDIYILPCLLSIISGKELRGILSHPCTYSVSHFFRGQTCSQHHRYGYSSIGEEGEREHSHLDGKEECLCNSEGKIYTRQAECPSVSFCFYIIFAFFFSLDTGVKEGKERTKGEKGEKRREKERENLEIPLASRLDTTNSRSLTAGSCDVCC